MSNSRGQTIALDLIMGVIIFLSLMATTLTTWSNSATVANRQLQEGNMQQAAERALDALLKGSAPMANCSTSATEPISLAKRDRVLDEEKVNQFVWSSGLLEDGLVGVWHLNGNEEDSYGDNDGSFLNGASADAEGLWGTKAMRLDGGSGFVRIAELPHDSMEVTYAVWIKSEDIAKDWARIIVEPEGAHFFIIYQHSNDGQIYVFATPNLFLNLTGDKCPFEENVWTHVAVTISKSVSMAKLYVNGSLCDTASGFIPVSTTNETVVLGHDTLNFVGFIEEARIYDRPLEEEEIRNLCQWESSFVKTKLLIGDNNYFFRLVEPGTPGTGSTVKNSWGDAIESGVDPDGDEIKEPLRLMRVKTTRSVTYEGAARIVEFTLHRLR